MLGNVPLKIHIGPRRVGSTGFKVCVCVCVCVSMSVHISRSTPLVVSSRKTVCELCVHLTYQVATTHTAPHPRPPLTRLKNE
jgi:hypothetical protein